MLMAPRPAPARRPRRILQRKLREVLGRISPGAPAADRSYDAGAIVALAIAKAGKADKAAIKTAISEVVAEGGTPIHAGKAEFERR